MTNTKSIKDHILTIEESLEVIWVNTGIEDDTEFDLFTIRKILENIKNKIIRYEKYNQMVEREKSKATAEALPYIVP